MNDNDTRAKDFARLGRLRAEIAELEASLQISGDEVGNEWRRPSPIEQADAYALVSEFASDFLSIHLGNGDYVWSSPSVTPLFGYTPGELVGNNAYQFFHPDDIERIAQDHSEHDGASQCVRYRLRCADGTFRWVETRSSALTTKDGLARIVCITRDIEVEKKLADAREQHASELKEANRGLERFAGVVSHELKSPLRRVASFSDLLLRRWTARESSALPNMIDDVFDETAEFLSLIAEETTRSLDLVEKILELSRAPHIPVSKAEVDLADLLRGEVARLPEGAPIVEIFADKELLVQADPELMKVVISNLLENSAKHNTNQRSLHVALFAERRLGRRVLCYADNGDGIDGDLEGVFQPFERYSSAPGSGIGLATVRKLVERMDGEIWAEEPGLPFERGAKFCMAIE